MPRQLKASMIQTELDATLERFERYLTGTRYDRRRRCAPSTAESYAKRLGLFLKWADTLTPGLKDAQEYMEHLANDAECRRTGERPSDGTKRVRFYSIKAWFEFKRTPLTPEQERDFLVPPNQLVVREMPLTMDNIQELLGAIPDRRRYAIVRTFLATGIRCAECVALKEKNVDWDSKRLWVPEIAEDGVSAAAKGGAGRGGWVCIDDKALAAIKEHLESRPIGRDPEAPLFESLLTHGHLTPDGMTHLVGDLTEGILGERITPHVLRHAFGSYAASGGPDRAPMPIKAIQVQMRHKRIETTMRYIHSVENLQDAYARGGPQF